VSIHRSCVMTLLTDFGNQDAYVGVMKGVITGINPLANIIDICHNIPPQDVFNAAYLLYTSYKYFPKKTIHVAVVDPGVGSRRDIVCVETKDYFFLVPDNGLLSFIVQEEKPKVIVRLANDRYFLPSPSNTFHGRDVFAPAAAYLSLGVKLRQLGIKIDQLEQLEIPKPVPKKAGQVEGQIIYIDRFGNIITNITREHLMQHDHSQSLFKTQMKEITLTISLPSQGGDEGGVKINLKCLETTIGKKKIVGLCKTYTDAKPGEPLVLFGSAGFLEVSVNQGNAQKYFKADKGSKIIVEIGQSPF